MTLAIPEDIQPRSEAVVLAIEAAIRAGELRAGDRLPSHRGLARQAGLGVGTITRAYAEAERRGLVLGEVGRGTFVRHPAGPPLAPRGDETMEIDLGPAWPVCLPAIETGLMASVLREVAAREDVGTLATSPSAATEQREQDVAGLWLQRMGHEVESSRVVVAEGFHAALHALLGALASPGDLVLTEEATYPLLPTLAHRCHLRIEGLAMDEHGLRPDALERACATRHPRLLHIQPTHHSPTGLTMPLERRAELAAIASAHDLTVLEHDEDQAFLDRPIPTVASLAPDHGILIADAGRALGLSLRFCALAAPEHLAGHVARAIREVTWLVSPLLVDVAGRLLEGPGASTLIAARRRALEERHAALNHILEGAGGARLSGGRHAHHAWLTLPTGWTGPSFTLAAAARSVAVTPAEAFHVGRRSAPAAVRLALGNVADLAQLEDGATRLRNILHAGVSSGRPPV